MSDKRKVNVDGEDFEVSMEKEGDFWIDLFLISCQRTLKTALNIIML